jgi:transposase
MARAHSAAALDGRKEKLGETSRIGERTLRRLLIIGASAIVR